jgi:hypothetical protein
MKLGWRRAALVAAVAALGAPARRAGATSALDYVEHIFGVTNVNAVGGHGGLTVGVAADGDLTLLSWPSPGYDDQIAYLTSNDIDGRSLPHFGAPDGMGSYLGLVVTTAHVAARSDGVDEQPGVHAAGRAGAGDEVRKRHARPDRDRDRRGLARRRRAHARRARDARGGLAGHGGGAGGLREPVADAEPGAADPDL